MTPLKDRGIFPRGSLLRFPFRSSVFSILLFLLLFSTADAQKNYTVSGIIKSAHTGETIIGASINLQSFGAATISNEFGFYSLSVPDGRYTLSVSAIGFEEKVTEVVIDKDLTLDVSLENHQQSLDSVIVTAKRGTLNISAPQMSVDKLALKDIRNLPALFGERDVLKAVQLLPGIKAAGDGNSGFFVRGGAADQNLILLDGAPVYNAAHLLGFFSVFNSDAIKDVTVYKGGMPAQYGGRLSSVLDIRMNDGNKQRHSVSGGIGLISSRINAEGPLRKETSSYLISGRRTYADMFLKLSRDSSINRNKLYFYDLNTKLNFRLGKKDQLFVSGYIGRDVLGFRDRFGIDWGNVATSVQWNHVFNNKLYSVSAFSFSNYDYEASVKTEADDFKILSQIRDWTVRHEYQWYPNSRNTIRFGINSIYHVLNPGEVRAGTNTGVGDLKLQERHSWDNAVFATNTWKATDRLSVAYGLRLGFFSVLGKGNYYELDPAGKVSDTLYYPRGAFVKTYINAEPRLAVTFLTGSSSSVKLSYTRNVQNLHLLSNSVSTNPTDKWVASSNIIRPEIADQVALGFYKTISNSRYEFSLEAYYKNMQNQIDYRNGANIYSNDAVESQLLFGRGRAYGIEWLAKKTAGRLTGWLSYTLSKTERRIDGINNNNWYNARQDRTHDVAVVGLYRLNEKWTFSANWIFYTGDAVTFPSGKYRIDDKVVFYYTERNGYRMPNYHRLDLSATMQLKKTNRFSSELAFSLYNAYGRENAYTISFRQSEEDPDKTEAVQTTLFKYIPSISYNFKF